MVNNSGPSVPSLPEKGLRGSREQANTDNCYRAKSYDASQLKSWIQRSANRLAASQAYSVALRVIIRTPLAAWQGVEH
jgi:hypothetical protein